MQRIKKVEMAIFRPLVKLSVGLDGKGTFLNFNASSNDIRSSPDFSMSGEIPALCGVVSDILKLTMIDLSLDFGFRI